MGKHKVRNKETIILIVILLIVLITAVVIFLYKYFQKDETQMVMEPVESAKIEEPIKQPQINIFSGNDRPIAVMLDNHKLAWPHAGINSAYCVYEIIVEGGETRLMALFKGKDLQEIGPVRSSRHYFLDYALENDAIYVHYGWSPQAQSDISKLKVNNINGITENESDFWRVKTKSAPHNVFTKTNSIISMAESKRHQYSTTSNESSVLHYVEEEVELESETVANQVTIPYSTLHTVSYKYNPETKLYTRYARNKVQTEYSTKEEVTTKNIIITFAENYELQDGENKGRQGLKNIGKLDGYYITNGKAIKITCDKTKREGKTVYKDLEGNEINVNDGNTFINICPINANVTFE